MDVFQLVYLRENVHNAINYDISFNVYAFKGIIAFVCKYLGTYAVIKSKPGDFFDCLGITFLISFMSM